MRPEFLMVEHTAMRMKNRLRTMIIALGLIISASGAAAAFFTDDAKAAPKYIRSGSVRFSYPDDEKPDQLADKDFSVIADLGELGDRLEPYREGEDIYLSFKTFLGGDSPVIAVPRLEVITKGLLPGGHISVYMREDGKEEKKLAEISGTDGSSFIYGDPSSIAPGKERSYDYRIHIDKLPEENFLELNFDFSIAASQLNNNEELLSGDYKGEEAYKEIKDKYDKENSDIAGFTDHTDLRDAVDEEGEAISMERIKKRAVRLIPNILIKGNGGGELQWFLLEGENRQSLASEPDGSLRVLINIRHIDRSFEYEFRNEAGLVTSEEVRFAYDEGTGEIYVLE